MAVSKLDQLIFDFSKEKNLELSSNKAWKITQTAKQLDRGEIDLSKAMEIIREELKEYYIKGKISESDYKFGLKGIEKKVGWNLNK